MQGEIGLSLKHILTKGLETEPKEERIPFVDVLDSLPSFWGTTTTSGIMKRFPDIQNTLVDKWTKVASENIIRSLEHGEELADLKNKVEELSSGLVSLKDEVLSCKECIDRLYSDFTDRPIVKETRLFDIADDLEIIEPIPIVIEQTEDECIASFPEVEIFAVGAGEAEAITKLKIETRALYYELLNTPDEQLGRVPQSWKRILGKVIKSVG